jgi:hypothetical protein
MKQRRSPTPSEKWASCILQLRRGTGAPIVTREEAKPLSPREIIRLFNSRVIYAHGGAHANGGSMHPTNLWPTPRDEDAKQTPKDISQIAKGKRIRQSEAEHKRTMAHKAGLVPIDVRGGKDDHLGSPLDWAWSDQPSKLRRRRKMQSRPFQKGKRPMRRRGR